MPQVVHSVQGDASLVVIQPMPPLGAEQLAALRDDIAANGVLVPITVDQHGRIIDGNNRAAIALELGVDCPRVEMNVNDDTAAVDMAVTLNCARRHLNREQVRDLIRSEIARRVDDSDRAIARRVGCSPSTVGAVRKERPEVSKLDSPDVSVEEVAASVAKMKDALDQARGALFALVGLALENHVTVAEVLAALTLARIRFNSRTDHDDEQKDFFAKHVYDYVIEVASWAETQEQFPPRSDCSPSQDERVVITDSIVAMGAETHPADLVAK